MALDFWKEPVPQPERDRRHLQSRFSLTLEDHRRIKSTTDDKELRVLEENPGKTYAEAIGDTGIQERILVDIQAANEIYVEALKGDQIAIKTLRMILRNYLGPDIEYLRSIGKLPSEADFDPYTRYAI
jgi:hypothetical protein